MKILLNKELILENTINSDQNKAIMYLDKSDIKKYSLQLKEFFKKHNIDADVNAAEDHTVLIYNNKIVGIWMIQYSNTHHYYENVFHDCDANLGKAMPLFINELRSSFIKDDFPMEIFIPEKNYNLIKNDISAIKDIKLEKVSKYHGNYTLEILK